MVRGSRVVALQAAFDSPEAGEGRRSTMSSRIRRPRQALDDAAVARLAKLDPEGLILDGSVLTDATCWADKPASTSRRKT